MSLTLLILVILIVGIASWQASRPTDATLIQIGVTHCLAEPSKHWSLLPTTATGVRLAAAFGWWPLAVLRGPLRPLVQLTMPTGARSPAVADQRPKDWLKLRTPPSVFALWQSRMPRKRHRPESRF